MTVSFSKEYSLPFERSPGPGTLHLKYVESHGSDIDDLCANALISLETDHGGEGPDWDLGDLPDDVIQVIMQDFSAALLDAYMDWAAEQGERDAMVRELNERNGR